MHDYRWLMTRGNELRSTFPSRRSCYPSVKSPRSADNSESQMYTKSGPMNQSSAAKTIELEFIVQKSSPFTEIELWEHKKKIRS